MKRQLTHAAVLAAAMLAAGATASAAEITLFSAAKISAANACGANDAIHNLANSGFNDRASSAIVRDGSVAIVRRRLFPRPVRDAAAGTNIRRCARSASTIACRRRGSSAVGAPPPSQADGRLGRRCARRPLRELRLPGRPLRRSKATRMPNLGNTGFNDRAQSMRVERGYWIFCSDAGFQGDCRTFGPGNYPTLSWSRQPDIVGPANLATIIRTTHRRTGASSAQRNHG